MQVPGAGSKGAGIEGLWEQGAGNPGLRGAGNKGLGIERLREQKLGD